MKARKKVIILMFPIVLVLAIVMFILEMCISRRVGHYSFYSNLTMSIFGSGFLVLIVYLIEYFVEKRRVIEAYLVESVYMVNEVAKIKCFKNVDKIDERIKRDEFRTAIRAYCQFCDLDISRLGRLYSDIDLLFGNDGYKVSLYNRVYKKIFDMQKKVEEYKWHFDMFLENEIINDKVMKSKFEQLQNLFFSDKIEENDGSRVIRTYFTFLHELIDNIEEIESEIYKKEKKQVKHKACRTSYM